MFRFASHGFHAVIATWLLWVVSMIFSLVAALASLIRFSETTNGGNAGGQPYLLTRLRRQRSPLPRVWGALCEPARRTGPPEAAAGLSEYSAIASCSFWLRSNDALGSTKSRQPSGRWTTPETLREAYADIVPVPGDSRNPWKREHGVVRRA